MAPKALMLDLVAMVATRPRPYVEVIDAWRTNCPRLTVWEDTLEAGLVVLRPDGGGGLVVAATAEGLAALEGR